MAPKAVRLIIVPHQDDEMLGCYMLMKNFGSLVKVVTVFKGGGEPKPNHFTPDELHKARCSETIEACSKLGVTDFEFLRIERGTARKIVEQKMRMYLEFKNPSYIYTIFPYDNHPEHMLLGSVMKDIGLKNTIGFIVQTDYLRSMRGSKEPYLSFKLTDVEYEEKKKLIDLYRTQSHFLPNIVRRPEYRLETFWRMDGTDSKKGF